MRIRRELPADWASSRAVQVDAFRNGPAEPVEADLLDALRACDGWIPALSWIAEFDGEVVGHNVCTRAFVTGTSGITGTSGVGGMSSVGETSGVGGPFGDTSAGVACVGLGPIGVTPNAQGAGVGSALMHAMIGAADALGEPLIALLGNPGYYERFGFVASVEVGIAPPAAAWGSYFQILRLSSWTNSIKGQFRYAAPFENL